MTFARRREKVRKVLERHISIDLFFRRNSSLTDLTEARLDRCVVVNNGVQISADGRLRLPAEPSTAITAVKIKYEASTSGGGGGEVLIDTAGDLGGGRAAAVVAAEEGEEEAGRDTCGTCGGIFCDCRPFADSR